MKKSMTGKEKKAAAAAAAKKGDAQEGATTEAKKTKQPKQEIIPVLKAGALSLDVGPAVIAGFAEALVTEQEANRMLQDVGAKRYDLLARLTNGIIKAAKADASIKLGVAFDSDAKSMGALNNQLGLALGFREVVETGKGDNVRKKIVVAKACASFFPAPGDDKNSDEYKRKSTLRSNFLHAMKKCAQAAEGIITSGAKVQTDKASGTLKLSGPAIKERFGVDNVLLNEKQTIGEGDKKKKLEAKPSFTEMAKVGAAAHGKAMGLARPDSRSGVVDTAKSVIMICGSLVTAIGKLDADGKKDAKVREALASVESAVDSVIGQ